MRFKIYTFLSQISFFVHSKLLFSFLCLAYPSYTLARQSGESVVFSKQKDAPLNFGMLVHNDYHTIYRSQNLGKDGLKKLAAYLKSQDLPFPKIIIHMNRHGYKADFPLFSQFALEEYELQGKYNFEYFHSYRYPYRTYLDGHNPYEPEKDIDDKKYLSSKALKYFGLIKDNAPDGGMDAFIRIMHLILGAKEPVLFHCTGGHHRTGMIAMAIRYLQGGDWVDGQKRKVFVNFSEHELNPAQYEYYLHNKMLFRDENVDFIEEFYDDARFKELSSAYSQSLNK